MIFLKSKIKIILIAGLGVLAGFILLFIGRTYNAPINLEKTTINLDGKDYTLFIARTAIDKMRGLSNIEKLEGADGMIFYFDPPQKATFWNKKTFLDLELIWMKNGKIVGRDFLPAEGEARLGRPAENKGGLVVKSAPWEVDSVVELVR